MPLILSSYANEQLAGKIAINNLSFHRIKALKLTCFQRCSDGGVKRKTALWCTKTEPVFSFNGDACYLSFNFQLAQQLSLSSNNYYWEVSLDYVDKMENAVHIWRVPTLGV